MLYDVIGIDEEIRKKKSCEERHENFTLDHCPPPLPSKMGFHFPSSEFLHFVKLHFNQQKL